MRSARDLEVLNFKRVSGGSSRETYSFDLGYSENGVAQSRPMILRRDPTGGLLQSSREREFKIIDAMCKAGLKVPAALFLELGSAPLERPFFVMERAEGRVSPGAVAETE